MSTTGLLPERAKRRMALLLAQTVTHAAVGRGTWPDLFNPPGEDYLADGLADEIGRIEIDAVRYLIPDPAGPISFDGDPASYRYATAPETAAALADPLGPIAPSADMEFAFVIPQNTITGQVICQVGLFTDSVTAVTGFAAFPGQVTSPGQPLYLVNFSADSIYANKEFDRRVRIDMSN